ncbi:hypothetical protein [Umezawaea sp. NPDC059074]|uniref:hypothetical protein n=1 Tax=Umezawaea sp. NPDC059074 TaxID=3346716 RepID=UPI0036A19340
MSNPLVAQAPQEGSGFTQGTGDNGWATGFSLAESAMDTFNGFKDGNWIEGGLGVVGLAADAASMAIDPFGTLMSSAASFLMEHVQPLKDMLDWLAGDPPVIESYSTTWTNVSTELGKIAEDYATALNSGTEGWTGAAADAYRASAKQQGDALTGAASSAGSVGTVVGVMGMVVAFVREMVRDLIADLIAKLIAWVLEAVFSLGFGTPVIVAQAITAISKWAARIAKLVQKLLDTIKKVSPMLKRLVEIFEKIMKVLGKLAGKATGLDVFGTKIDDPGFLKKLGRDGVDTPSGSHTGSPDSPSTPGSSSQPDGPGTSSTPGSSSQPDGPGSSSTPGSSSQPDGPGSSSTPGSSSQPDGPGSSSTPGSSTLPDGPAARPDTTTPSTHAPDSTDPASVRSTPSTTASRSDTAPSSPPPDGPSASGHPGSTTPTTPTSPASAPPPRGPSAGSPHGPGSPAPHGPSSPAPHSPSDPGSPSHHSPNSPGSPTPHSPNSPSAAPSAHSPSSPNAPAAHSPSPGVPPAHSSSPGVPPAHSPNSPGGPGVPTAHSPSAPPAHSPGGPAASPHGPSAPPSHNPGGPTPSPHGPSTSPSSSPAASPPRVDQTHSSASAAPDAPHRVDQPHSAPARDTSPSSAPPQGPMGGGAPHGGGSPSAGGSPRPGSGGGWTGTSGHRGDTASGVPQSRTPDGTPRPQHAGPPQARPQFGGPPPTRPQGGSPHAGPPPARPAGPPHAGPPARPAGPPPARPAGPPHAGPPQARPHGPSQGGPPRQGPPHQGPPRDPHTGPPHQGPPRDPHTGPPHQGPARDPHTGAPHQPQPRGPEPSGPPHHDVGPNGHQPEPRPSLDEAHVRHAETTPAGVSHHRGDSDMGDLPSRVPNDPRYFTADVHVTPDGRARIGNHTYSPEEYGDLLRRSGWDGKTPIRLIGCDAGSNDFAKRLAAHTDAPVLAPTKPAWTDSQGRVYTSDAEVDAHGNRTPRIPPNGEWETHQPDGTRVKSSDDGFAPGTHDADKTDLDPSDARDRADTDDQPNDQPDEEHPHKAPSATEPREHPTDFPDHQVDPGPAPDSRDPDYEQDRSRGTILEQVDITDPDRVTMRDGRIETIDGKPVKEYVADLAQARAEALGGRTGKDNGPYSAVAIDRRTGLITEGVNGRNTDVIDEENLHPLLRENIRDMDEWQHPVMRTETEAQQAPVIGENGKAVKDANGEVVREDWVLQGRVHSDEPLRHAEVKATNELLWARQRQHEADWHAEHGPDSTPPPLSREALQDVRVDPRNLQDQYRKIDGERTQVGSIGDPGPACGNCNVILRDVGSYTGRLQFAPHDYRSSGSLIPPVTE